MVEPADHWHDMSSILEQSPVAASSPVVSVAGSGPSLSSEVPMPSRAKGKTGARWTKEDCRTFLHECLEYQKELQLRVVPSFVYEKLSDKLWSVGLNFSAEMLKEKLRNLKRSYSEAKRGKHNGQFWEYYNDMSKIYDQCPTTADNCAGTSVVHHLGEGSKDQAPKNDVTYIIDNPVQDQAPKNDVTYIIDSPVQDQGRDIVKESIDVTETPVDMEDVGTELDHDSFLMGEVEEEDVNNNIESPNANEKTSSFILTPTCSPASKKTKNDKVEHDTTRSTPRKTPKRKAPGQCHLVWSVSDTDKFLKQCIIFKTDVQKDNPPLDVWKKIESNISDGTSTWQQYRSKFYNMNKFFFDTMMPVNGVLGGVKWPHYDDFLEIHDFPPDYVPPVVANGLLVDGNKIWEKDTVTMLINLYKERYSVFKGSKSTIRHTTLYAEIAGTLNQYDVQVSGKQCQSKIKDLESIFRKEYDASRRTGAAPSEWEFFGPMKNIYEGNASLEATYAYSVGGNKPMYTCKGKEVEEEERGARRRPSLKQAPEPIPDKGQAAKKRPIYTSQNTLLQERQVAAREDLTRELRLMRTNMELSSARRLNLMESLVNSVSKLATIYENKK
ncbi:hypothetical protein ONE63_008098 [Megalurothrips usitatus]|uniref:Myb/SANT-like DNA-binding domain-containing protein n=1 Tax=Megalurothrips usitatus TaxID=439358 RepID=A0AAV7XTW4_9NEOP|nr:hypothetical protein ONE63_008098 [Megalurothrips usitatus]